MTQANGTNSAPLPKGVNIPAGYKEKTTDIVGFWNPDKSAQLHFIPRYCKLSDSKLDPTKPSTLVVGECVDPFEADDPTDGEKTVLVNKGDIVGVWTKAGMSALKDLGGIPVLMFQDGEKDVGRPSPMKVFRCFYNEKLKGARLPVTQDARRKSLPARQAPAQAGAEDDIPF